MELVFHAGEAAGTCSPEDSTQSPARIPQGPSWPPGSCWHSRLTGAQTGLGREGRAQVHSEEAADTAGSQRPVPRTHARPFLAAETRLPGHAGSLSPLPPESVAWGHGPHFLPVPGPELGVIILQLRPKRTHMPTSGKQPGTGDVTPAIPVPSQVPAPEMPPCPSEASGASPAAGSQAGSLWPLDRAHA